MASLKCSLTEFRVDHYDSLLAICDAYISGPSSMDSVAPNPRLEAELDRVAESARKFTSELTKTNIKENDEFPKKRLSDVADTLNDLNAGSEDGALPALEYAEAALADMRYSFVEIAKGDELPDFVRGGRVDDLLGTLISDISTAKRFYSQSKLDAAARSQTPDHAIGLVLADQSGIAEQAQAIWEIGVDLAAQLDNSSVDLAVRHDPDQIVAETLSRKSRDVANLARQEGIEIGGRRPRIAWIERLDRGLEHALRGVELIGAVGAITVQKIGDVLVNHVRDWFVGTREWAQETREVVAMMKRQWQEEQSFSTNFTHSSDTSLPNFSIIRDSFKDGQGRSPELIVIPAGEFLMGSAESESLLKPEDRALDNEIVKGPRKRLMRISRPFALGRYPVTYKEYEVYLAATGQASAVDQTESRDINNFGHRLRPVVNVSWSDAQAYCTWLSEKTGLRGYFRYRLPSEAEWEYACRAGTQTRRWWGDDWDPEKANGNRSFEGGKTSPVDHYAANSWGLYDMIGNVFEWCADWFTVNISDLPGDGAAFAGTQDSLDVFRVSRGGAWSSIPQWLRSAVRGRSNLNVRDDFTGFRIARTL
jgi:formylglycine-generating enzyme required for sulfatase activity